MTIAKLPTRRRGFIFGTFLVGLLFASGAARADGDAATFVQAMGNEAAAMLADSSLDSTERRHQLRTLLLGKFDFDAISRFVLGRHWHDTSDEERTEFRRLFGEGAFNAAFVPLFAKRLEGDDPTSLEGLPLIALCQILRKLGLDPLAKEES